MDAEDERDDVDDDGLDERPHAAGDGLAEDQRDARGGADQHLLHDAEVALPDDGDAVEDGDEERALGQHAGGQEVEVGQVPGAQDARLGQHLTEDDQPQDGLEGPGHQLVGVVDDLADLAIGDRQRIADEAERQPSAQPSRSAVRRVRVTSR